jgi:DNA repair and recombination RAD54-like protein
MHKMPHHPRAGPTHRCRNGKQMVGAPEGTINTGATAADTSSWNHYSSLDLFKVHDVILKEQGAALKDIVTFVFQNKSHDQQVVKLK